MPHVFRHPIATLVVALTLTSCLTLGCSMFSDDEAPSPTAGADRTDAQIFVGDTIEMNYDPNVILKRAESFHEQEGYAEAIVEYQHFLELHRNHILAPYAQYRLALSHFKMIQTIDRDMTPVKKAREEFRKLIDEFPASQYEAEAWVKIKECKGLLAKNHLFVGTFYYKRNQYLAAARRFEKIIDLYPSMEEAVEAKLQLAKTYQKLGAMKWARDWAVNLIQQHPRHKLRADGHKLLATLQDENPNIMTAARPRRSFNATVSSPGFLPTTPAETAFNGTASRGSRPASTMTDCPLGSWCGTTGMSLSNALAPNPPVAPSVTCRPGTWCQ
ncbi:MAG: outer membrane protein assembly factor BamD [Nitrospira sp. SB0673_bin_12]|nr:outer membrane protein assembly factor BamD [Nitrospira sp. SB0673_bin_12]